MSKEQEAAEAAQLQKRLQEGLFQKAGVCDDVALQTELTAIAEGYVQMLHRQRAIEDSRLLVSSEREERRIVRQYRDITSDLEQWNQHALDTVQKHRPALSRISLNRTGEAGREVVRGVIEAVLDVLEPERHQRKTGKCARYSIPRFPSR